MEDRPMLLAQQRFVLEGHTGSITAVASMGDGRVVSAALGEVWAMMARAAQQEMYRVQVQV